MADRAAPRAIGRSGVPYSIILRLSAKLPFTMVQESRSVTRSSRRRAQEALSSQRRRCAEDVAFRALHDGKQFLMLRLRHIEFRHRVVEVFAKSVPFTLGDLKVFMGFAHGTACSSGGHLWPNRPSLSRSI